MSSLRIIFDSFENCWIILSHFSLLHPLSPNSYLLHPFLSVLFLPLSLYLQLEVAKEKLPSHRLKDVVNACLQGGCNNYILYLDCIVPLTSYELARYNSCSRRPFSDSLSLFVSLSHTHILIYLHTHNLSASLSHTHTHTHTHIHTYSTHTLSLSHTHTLSLTYTLTHTLSLSHSVLREVQRQSYDHLSSEWQNLDPETLCAMINDNQVLRKIS